MIDISVIILTFNEEANLRMAIESVVSWANDIFIVDSYSSDKTVDIALGYSECGVKVVQHKFEDYSKQWNWALKKLPISTTWTLKLDADERATMEFKKEAEEIIAAASIELSGIYFRRKIVFMGRELRWGGMTDNYDLRMWRTGCAWFEDRSVNEHACVMGKNVKMKEFVLHENSNSLTDWLEKHNRYASLEAQNLIKGDVVGEVKPKLFGMPDQRRMWLKEAYYKVPARAFFYFLYRYIFRLGFLDGKNGFRFALLHAMFIYWIDLKIDEYKFRKLEPKVNWPKRGNPHHIVLKSKIQQSVDLFE